MPLKIGYGKKSFLARWSEDYQEMVVGKEISTFERINTYKYPFVIINADTLKEANIHAAKIKSIDDMFARGGCEV